MPASKRAVCVYRVQPFLLGVVCIYLFNLNTAPRPESDRRSGQFELERVHTYTYVRCVCAQAKTEHGRRNNRHDARKWRVCRRSRAQPGGRGSGAQSKNYQSEYDQ